MTSDSKDSKNHGNRKPKRKVPGSEISQLIPEKTSRTAVGRPAKNLVAKGGESGSVTVDPPTVVGVGASAGGLDAFQKLLRHLPADTGMAFVLIQHLDPHHISHLPDLLAKTTSMPVVEVREDIAIEADHVYTIAPDTTLGIYHGMLRVYERVTKRGKHLPVDFFLHSLAEECGDRSIGVVLSGTASDGTEGLGAIKAAGGFTFAESERSAEYFGMPGSAISAGCVDFVLPPNQIANQLARIARTPIPKSGGSADAHKQYPKGDLSKIFLLLRLHTGNDFSEYKKSTILRRISRRMTVLKMDQLSDYIRYLQNTHEEIDALFQEVLINVTQFFRDPESFEFLRTNVFRKALERHPVNDPFRIWIPGCSSGEEAYTVAMIAHELAASMKFPGSIQIFATDIDTEAVELARKGFYSDHSINGMSKDRLGRYFVRVSDGYQIKKIVRDMCVFAVQNVIKDPPFSRLDLICCRNVLIYLGSTLQRRLLQVFHYALNPGGALMLGVSESVGSQAELYRLISSKHKIYEKKSVASHLRYRFTDFTPEYNRNDVRVPHVESEKMTAKNIDQAADRLVLEKYGPPGVIVDQNLDILSFRGETGPYLNPSPGTATLNLLKLVKKEILMDLRVAIREAQEQRIAVRRDQCRHRRGEKNYLLTLSVIPVSTATKSPHLLVLFEDAIEPTTEQVTTCSNTEDSGKRPRSRQIQALEIELESTRKYLQSIISDQEGTNEELQCANEEIQSTNEELQSINEELETAREELQSTNEEIATVNDELRRRNEELTSANSDLRNLLLNSNLSILILDGNLRIRQFTPVARNLFGLIDTDIGRPFTDLKTSIEIAELEEKIVEVVDTTVACEFEVTDKLGDWYSVRIRPYTTSDHHIDGAVITLSEINSLKTIEELQAKLEQERQFAAVVRDSNDAVTVQGFDGFFQSWNASAERIYGYSETEALSMSAEQLLPAHGVADYRELISEMKKGNRVELLTLQRVRRDGEQISVAFTATPLVDSNGNPYAFTTTERELDRTTRIVHEHP